MASLPISLRHGRKVGVALAAAALLTVTGCAGGAPSVVAYVGDSEISAKQLKEGVAGVAEAFGPEQQVEEQAIVDAMVRGEVASQLAAKEKITLTNTERDALFAGQAGGGNLLANEGSKKVAYDLADEQLVAQKLGPEKYLAGLKAAKVKLNPRYGVWSPEAAAQGSTAVQAQSGSLSTSGTAQK